MSRIASAAALAAALLLGACSRSDLLVLRGNVAAANGEYSRATVAYLAALERAGSDDAAYVLYDLGNVYAALGEPAAARDTIGRALDARGAPGAELLFRSRFNLGTLEYEQTRYQQAAESFAEALRNKPGDIDAKVNLEMSLRRITEGTAPPPRGVEQRLDRRTSEILDIARKKEGRAWRLEPREKPPEKGDDW